MLLSRHLRRSLTHLPSPTHLWSPLVCPQAERHATLDGLCASLLPRLSSGPSCPPPDHLDHSSSGPSAPHGSARLSPIREAGSSSANSEPSFSDMAADIRGALSKLVDRWD